MSYSSDSPADRLAAVRAAIDRCLTSQQYTSRGRMQMMAQLRDLRELEKDLQGEVADGSGAALSLVQMMRPE